MVSSFGDGEKRGPGACAEPDWEPVAEGAGGREREPPPPPPPPELTAGTEMQLLPLTPCLLAASLFAAPPHRLPLSTCWGPS